ncbi:PEP-CTERM sorting domain-containing protein [Sphingobium lactosutens]|uniref:PEP-CTERM sorting domain-containing protein n=1 Tax=Sphingobium lactosutens TaxID=522773 RepID=UPI0015BC8804|nr:PEP-CTERM sorting domain-containing protein [Sphingobium lactosutens]NWK94149.1 PEP-CTERM sorting domain-containing protein [Sphingobium lactosutens]
MKLTKMLLAVGAAGLMGAAVPAPAQATWWCWFGKCSGSSSSGGGDTGSSGGGSSGGDPTKVPEPEQMALFGMGAAVLAGRVLYARRKKK